MTFTSLQNVLWAAGIFGNAALFTTLLLRSGARSFPFFTVWIFFQILRSITLFLLHRSHLDYAYYLVYWYEQIPELLIMLGIAFELARHVLRPRGSWNYGVKRPFAIFAALAVLIALLMTTALRPTLPTTFFAWLYPSNLFSSALLFELGVAVLVTAHHFGLAWRNRVMGLAQGWLAWSGVVFAAEAVQSYWPQSKFVPVLVQSEMYAYLAAAFYWTVSFWRQEPSRRPMTPEMRAVLFAGQAELSTDVKSLRKAP